MQRFSFVILVGVTALGIQAPSAESVLSQYRGMTLGDSRQAVVDQLQVPAESVKVVQEHPALVQQVTWRPRPFISGSAESDSIAEMLLTFHAGELTQIAVTYAREQTHGLTDADMREAIEANYGPSLLLSTPMRPSAAPSPQLAIGQWDDGKTLIILWREQFPNRFGLSITSIAFVAALQQGIADGARVEAEAAPARELAWRAAEAAVIRERDDKIRLENKAKFKP